MNSTVNTKSGKIGIFLKKHKRTIFGVALVVCIALIALAIAGKFTPTKKDQKTTNGAPSAPTDVASSIKTPSTKSTYADRDDISDTGLFISFKSPLQSGIENNTNIKYYLIQIIKDGEGDINYIKSEADGGPPGSQFNTSSDGNNKFKWKTNYRGETTGGTDAELFLPKNAIGITETGSYKIKVQAANDNDLLSAAAYSPAIEYDVCKAGNANACGWTDNSWTGGLTSVVTDRYVPEASSETGQAGVDVQYAKPVGQPCEPLTKEPNTLYKYDNAEQCVAHGCVSSDYYLDGTKCLKQPAAGDYCTIGDNKVYENNTGNIFYKIPLNVEGGGGELVCDSIVDPQDPRIGCDSMAIPEGSGIASWSMNNDTGKCDIICENENYKPNAGNTACEPKTCADDGETVSGGFREGTYPECVIKCYDTHKALMDDAGSTVGCQPKTCAVDKEPKIAGGTWSGESYPTCTLTCGENYNPVLGEDGTITDCQPKTCEEVNGQKEGGTWSGNITENNCTLECGEEDYKPVTNDLDKIVDCQPKTCTDKYGLVQFGSWSGEYPPCQATCNEGYTSNGLTCEPNVVKQEPSCTPESFSDRVATVFTTSDGECAIKTCKRPYIRHQQGNCVNDYADPVYWSKSKINGNENVMHGLSSDSKVSKGLYAKGEKEGTLMTNETTWGKPKNRNNKIWFDIDTVVNEGKCARKCLEMDLCKSFQIRRGLEGTIGGQTGQTGNECKFFSVKNTGGSVKDKTTTYNRRNVVQGETETSEPVGLDSYNNAAAGINAASIITDY